MPSDLESSLPHSPVVLREYGSSFWIYLREVLAKKLLHLNLWKVYSSCPFYRRVFGTMAPDGVRISSTFSVLRPFSYLRPFLHFVRFTSTRVLRTLYFDSLTSTSVLRPFVKSGFLGREHRSKYSFGRSKV